MSDWEQQGPGTTTVMPPAPPADTGTGLGFAPGPGAGGAGGVPLWVLLVSLLATILVAGTATYLIAGAGGDARQQVELAALRVKNDDLSRQVADLTAALASAEAEKAAAEASATAAVAAAQQAAVRPTTVTQFTYVVQVTGSSSKGYKLVADYAQLLTGEAAADAATAHGDESPPPNDYYIVNDNPLLRTLTLSKTAKIVVLGWGGADATAKKTITIAQLVSVLPGGSGPQEVISNAPFTITITKGVVTKVEQYFIP